MTDAILFVDDEENILHSVKRDLRKRFNISTATSGAEALEILKTEGPFAVIVSDMRMPVMDGIQLLTLVKDLYPDTVRLMLTGNADQETAIDAVNKGAIFRFLNKPCSSQTLVMSLALALRQYRLVTSEKELLDKTLKGAITVLSEVLSLANPIAFSVGLRIKSLVLEMATQLSLTSLWQFELAALMSQIGCITIPSDILNKVYAGQELEPAEQKMYRQHPQVGAHLLEKIPRLETVAAIIAHQFDAYADLEAASDLSDEIRLGSQAIRIAIDFDKLLNRGMRREAALCQLAEEPEIYHPDIIKLLDQVQLDYDQERIISVEIRDMVVGMVAEQDIIAANGVLISPKGQEITWSLLQGLKNFAQQVGVKEPVLVKINKKYAH